MTIKERLEQLCTEHGLWPAEAEKVVAAQKETLDDDMKRRWNDQIKGYPIQLLAVLFLGTKREALKYIDAEKPKHFARPMFEKEP